MIGRRHVVWRSADSPDGVIQRIRSGFPDLGLRYLLPIGGPGVLTARVKRRTFIVRRYTPGAGNPLRTTVVGCAVQDASGSRIEATIGVDEFGVAYLIVLEFFLGIFATVAVSKAVWVMLIPLLVFASLLWVPVIVASRMSGETDRALLSGLNSVLGGSPDDALSRRLDVTARSHIPILGAGRDRRGCARLRRSLGRALLKPRPAGIGR